VGVVESVRRRTPDVWNVDVDRSGNSQYQSCAWLRCFFDVCLSLSFSGKSSYFEVQLTPFLMSSVSCGRL
jgi:hypothetical protein